MAKPSDSNDKSKSNGSHRSRDGLIKAILRAVLNGYDTKMRIMHAAFVANGVATKALEELVAKGLLVVIPNGGKRYRITELGRKMVESS